MNIFKQKPKREVIEIGHSPTGYIELTLDPNKDYEIRTDKQMPSLRITGGKSVIVRGTRKTN